MSGLVDVPTGLRMPAGGIEVVGQTAAAGAGSRDMIALCCTAKPGLTTYRIRRVAPPHATVKGGEKVEERGFSGRRRWLSFNR